MSFWHALFVSAVVFCLALVTLRNLVAEYRSRAAKAAEDKRFERIEQEYQRVFGKRSLVCAGDKR